VRRTAVLGALCLVGCSAIIPYTHNDTLSQHEAIAAVERGLVSQLRNFTADYVEVTDDFIAYGQGSVTTGRSGGVGIPVGNTVIVAGGRSRSVTKAIQTRVYFDSLIAADLYARKGRFVVKVSTNDGQPPQHFYLYSQKTGQLLVDGIYSLKRQWNERAALRPSRAQPGDQADGAGASGRAVAP
jgi:hypothetical protein